ALGDLEESLRENFLKGNTVSAAEWEKIRNRLLIIHDRLPPDWISEELLELDGEGEYVDPGVFDSGPSRRGAFADYNNALPGHRRFRKLGEVPAPISADVYCAPES